MSKAHRGRYGDGSIYRDGDRYVGTIELGRDANGRRRRPKVTGRTQAEVRAKLSKLRRGAEDGVVPGGAMTVNSWLDHWMATVIPARAKSPNTIENYEWALSHIRPALGRRRLRDLTPEHVDNLLAAKAAAGMARNSVGRIRSVLASALRHAQARGHVVRNAAVLAVMPETRPPAERRSLTVDQAKAFLDAARGERLEALFVVGLATGLRPGELAGLTWPDADLDAGTITVARSLKREHGKARMGATKRATAPLRTIALAPWAVSALRAHRARQASERLALGTAWSTEWPELVFASEIGTPLDKSHLRRTMHRVTSRAGLGAWTAYELRHTAASLLIDSGQSVEQVADLLGDNPQTLWRHYRHRVRPVVDAAAGPMEAMFGG
jgi:integrase